MTMTTAFAEGTFNLLQFIALALPAITIYLQVLVSIHQKTQNLEIDGSVPHYVDEEGNREPNKEPNVIEALPASLTNAHHRTAFVLALISISLLIFAAVFLLFQVFFQRHLLVEIANVLTILGLIALLTSVGKTLLHSIQIIFRQDK